MKKTLSVLLATLMLLGVFAVGASAFELPTVEKAKQSRFNPLPAANLSAQAAGAELSPEIEAILDQVSLEAFLRFYVKIMMADTLSGIPAAYKAGKTETDLANILDAIDTAIEGSKQVKDLNAFLADTEAIKAAYANGTLKDELTRLYNAVFGLYFSELQKALREVFTADAMDFFEASSELADLTFIVMQADLTPEQRTSLEATIRALDMKYGDMDVNLENGNFKEAAKLLKSYTKDLKKIMAEFGLIEAPSIFARIWDFILRYIFFGWLWMK